MNLSSILWFVVPAVCIVSPGCATVKNRDMLHFLRDNQHQVSAIEYRIGIRDSITIFAPSVPEIDGATSRLQPDGKIHLKLLGEVSVVGLTSKEVAAKLEVLATRYYVDPEVTVRVSGFFSKRYYVRGPAGAAGAVPYSGRDTVLDAVIASGLSHRAWTSRVTVTRPAHDGEPVRTIRINVDKMVKQGDWSQNILLEPNDIVHIPPTPGMWLALKVRNMLFPIQPVVQAYTTPAYLLNAQDAYSGGRRGNFQNSGGGVGTVPF